MNININNFQTLDRYADLLSKANKSPDSCPDLELSELTGFLHPTHFLYTRMAKRAFEEKIREGEKGAQAARELANLCISTYERLKVIWAILECCSCYCKCL